MPSVSEALILANGEQILSDKIIALAQDKIVLVLDGAYHHAQEIGLHVDYLLGDFDSIKLEMLQFAKLRKIRVIEAADQNFTDLEKGIRFLDTLGISVIHICSGTGLRMDHTLHNIRLLTRYFNKKRKIYLYTKSERIFVLQDEVLQYQGRKGDGIAILGAPECTVTTKGLLYDMKNTRLSYARQSSVCNTMLQDVIELSIKDSALLVTVSSLMET